MQQPFRFIHASDFHLERPPRGLAEVPDHLRGAFVEAPYRAAERVFDAAIKERVDFVALAGDLLDPLATGPRGLVFIGEQFERLAEKGIKVYWAGGRADDFERWVEAWPLGDNVVRFPLHRAERVIHHRNGEPIAQILGTSSQQRKKIRASDFHADGSPLYSVAIAYGSADAEILAGHEMNFWALGGERARRVVLSGPTTAHYCGMPQARRPQETGPQGCTLVQIDETQRVRTNFIATDAIRYQHERVSVSETISSEQLLQVLNARIGELLIDPFGPDLLIYWNILGSKSLSAELRRGKLAAELLARLRTDHAQSRPAAWTVSIETDAVANVPGELIDEESVLGEFLRTVQHYIEHPEKVVDFEPFLAERHLAGSLGAAVALDAAERNRVLADVAALGMELLSPEESRS